MDADIKIVRLSRTTVEGKKSYQELPKNDCWFIADYFDLMQINTLSLKQPFAKWLDIRRDRIDDHEIAAQSYTLYCSSAMLEQYEGSDMVGYRGDPFEKKQGLECLSIIQVYITPEILARMEDGTDNICDANGVILQSFTKDIYDTLDIFSVKYPEEVFVARVYMMLSAGDFAVVVRSSKPDTAYRISTYLRKRRAGKVKGSCVGSPYVLYKTYTLSTIGTRIICCDEEQDKIQDDFIVRGCYSNIYWKEQDKVQEFIQKFKEGLKEFYPISGRYDFTARLTEEEFYQVMSAITKEEAEEGEDQSDLVQYLKFLIEGEYLSYINERYLMAKTEEEPKLSEQEMVSQSVFLWKKEEKVRELFDQNKFQIEKLLEKQKLIADDSKRILGYRKNIQQYLFLIKREISLCKSINELSDNRIYAKVLAEQLETILDSAERYISSCTKSSKNDIWIDMLEDHLRKAAVTIDSFAQYIRNNNLQSIQTPNYNIETSMGVEKVLIGYSELLWSFIEFYKQFMPSATKKVYLPVMIPNLHDRDVNVDVMFPEVYWDTEINKADSSGDDKCLMVIGSPTLEEVTDFPVMFSALFHEVAHQFRYEDRLERNQAVLHAAVKEVMHEVAVYINRIVNEKVGVASDDAGRLCAGLTAGLTQAFIDSKYPAGDSVKLKGRSLSQFKNDLFENINKMFEVWIWKSDLEIQIREFVFELRYELEAADEECRDLLVKLNEPFNGKPEDIGRIRECAFYLAGECASRYLDKTAKDLWTYEKAKGKGDGLWELKWEQIFGGIVKKDIQRIDRAIVLFWSWVAGYENQLYRLEYFDEDKWGRWIEEAEKFESILYSYMKEYWEKISQQSSSLYSTKGEIASDIVQIPSYRYWTRVGRYLGLDYEVEDRKRFSKVIKEMLAWQNLDFKPSLLGLYREETADLLMCNMMNMKPIGYLNLAVSLLVPSNGFYCGTDIERVFCVLYIQWCYVEGRGKEEAWETYRQTYCEVFDEARENSRKVLDQAGIVRPDEGVLYEKVSCEDNVSMYDEAETIIKKEMEYLEECRNKIQKLPDGQEKVEVLGELENILRLYNLLIDLIWNGKYYWNKLHDEEELLEDLAKGRKRLAGLREDANTYHGNAINGVFEVGDLVSEYLLHSYSQRGMGKSEELNQRCVELLLTMYYHNKIRIAQGSREGDTDEN